MQERSAEILNFIKKNPGCRVKDIQEYLKVSRPVIATALRTLEEIGLIRRMIGKGRSFSFYISKEGEEFLWTKAR